MRGRGPSCKYLTDNEGRRAKEAPPLAYGTGTPKRIGSEQMPVMTAERVIR
jgi:hypothetical protein